MKAIPKEYGIFPSTKSPLLLRRNLDSIFKRRSLFFWREALLIEYDEEKIKIDWQSIDTSMIKAPLGGESHPAQTRPIGVN